MALIPGPILYGIIIDNTCLVWNETCNKRGNCYTYDRRKMRVYLNSTSISKKIINIINYINIYVLIVYFHFLVLTSFGVAFDGVVWYLGKRLNLYENMPIIFEKELKKRDSKKSDIDELRLN